MSKILVSDGAVFSYDFPYEGDLSLSLKSREGSARVFTLTISLKSAAEVQSLKLKYSVDMKGIISSLYPACRRDRGIRQWFRPMSSESSFCFGAPVISAIKDGNKNYCTIALSDAKTRHRLTLCVNDFAEQEKLDFCIELFTEKTTVTEYSVDVLIDDGEKGVYDMLSSVGKWWQSYYPRKVCLNEYAEYPLYSTWYNCHQHPEQSLLTREIEKAAEAGFKAVIIDDGWQYDGLGTSDYYDCGDWQVSKEKFPDLKGLVEFAHQRDVKVMLWFPLPFVGFNTKAYIKFKDKLLYSLDKNYRAGILDTRYSEVRQFIIDALKQFVVQYGLDGVKLDFIDSFMLTEESPEYNDRMDTDSVDASVVKLLDGITEELIKLNPKIMVEFRQDYVGPAITAYANMLRVADCAFDPVTNRMAVADLRMFGYPLAVHSDMLYWSKAESAENCARQLLSVIFSVPQISVLLTEIPDGQAEVIKGFLQYHTAHRSVLLHGRLAASNADAGYSQLTAEGGDLRITVNYTKNHVVADGKRTDVFNASDSTCTVIENRCGELSVDIFDCAFKPVSHTAVKEKIFQIDVPIGGHAELSVK